MITNNDAQKAVITWIKDNATIMALLKDSNEVREESWSGEKFTYPNIRVQCEITPATGGCGPDTCNTLIHCHSEEKSSKQAQNIAGTIAEELHDKTFTKEGFRFSAVVVQGTPRATQETSIWRSDVQVTSKVIEAT